MIMGRMGMDMSETGNRKLETGNQFGGLPHRRVLAAALLLFFFLLNGCTVGPNYREPAATIPAAWGELGEGGAATGPATRPGSGATVVQWWKTFEDGDLNSLIDRAVASNLDLRRAQARVREARAQREFVRADLFPQ